MQFFLKRNYIVFHLATDMGNLKVLKNKLRDQNRGNIFNKNGEEGLKGSINEV